MKKLGQIFWRDGVRKLLPNTHTEQQQAELRNVLPQIKRSSPRAIRRIGGVRVKKRAEGEKVKRQTDATQ